MQQPLHDFRTLEVRPSTCLKISYGWFISALSQDNGGKAWYLLMNFLVAGTIVPSWDGGEMAWHLLTSFLGVVLSACS